MKKKKKQIALHWLSTFEEIEIPTYILKRFYLWVLGKNVTTYRLSAYPKMVQQIQSDIKCLTKIC